MPRTYGSAGMNGATGGGESWEEIHGRAKLDALLEKARASTGSSREGYHYRQALKGIDLYRRGLREQKAARALMLALAVVAGCSFGLGGLAYEPTKKHEGKEEMMQ